MGVAMLEPSLPLWMLDTMNAPKWQQGIIYNFISPFLIEERKENKTHNHTIVNFILHVLFTHKLHCPVSAIYSTPLALFVFTFLLCF